MAILNERAALLPSNVLTIDSNLRTISIPEKICNLGVETDANVQRLRFVMPRYYDTVDLDGFAIRINYQNAKGEGDVYAVTDAEATADTITFSWLVGPHALACNGKVKFIVCLKKLDEAGNVAQAYHTTVASLPVLEGLETCECIVEEHPDVLEQILLRLDALEKNSTGSGNTDPGTVAASGVTYLESPDAAGKYLYLRDLDTGPYVLSGYFRPFEGSSHSLGFSNAIVSVTRKDAGSHVMVLTALDCIVNFLEILVDDTAEGGHTYTRTNIKLPELWAGASNGIQYVESLDENNLVNLRDLTDGPYILYGYFHPYEGSPDSIPFDRAFASVINLTAGSHIMVYNPRNFKFDCYEVLGNATDGYTYTLENVGLLDLHTRISALEGRLYPDWSHLKWYVMGDSLTDPAGGVHTSKFYYEYIAEKTGIQIIVDGIGGTGYHAGVSANNRFADRVANIPADVDIVTIFGSGNDVKNATFDEYKAGMAAAMAYFFDNRPGLPVIIVPPSPWATYGKRSEAWKTYCDTLELVALNYSLCYVGEMWTAPPFDPNSAAVQQAFFTKCGDGVHPDENGHKLLAPYFYEAMRKVLAFK